MFILGMLSWWYGAGWRQRVGMLRERIAGTIDYFSIDLLLKTLFAPFRQISAGKVRGPIAVQMRAFFDRLISRIIGGVIRCFMILFGSIAIIIHALIGGSMLLAWAFIPLVPFVGFGLWIIGWLPWSQ